jgi:hypothetical protein
MLAKVTSCALEGLEGVLVDVEVDTSRGMPSLVIVGLPDAAVKESSERVRSAIKNSGLVFPGKRITVNLAPADIHKAGPAYDLPIAVGVLIASEWVWPQAVESALFIGELSLDGSVRHVNGVLPIAALAQQQGIPRVFVPACDAPEAALIDELEIIPIEHLAGLAAHLQGLRKIAPHAPDIDQASLPLPPYAADFSEIKGQEHEAGAGSGSRRWAQLSYAVPKRPPLSASLLHLRGIERREMLTDGQSYPRYVCPRSWHLPWLAATVGNRLGAHGRQCWRCPCGVGDYACSGVGLAWPEMAGAAGRQMRTRVITIVTN